ncbi:MAG: hypothetical protein CML13_15460 [Puniceicoccaceae bacterium]|nr:hypothetical protein [Puniceicoccaceae bacterium]|tara:strand:- start:1463 stop:2800 length:1338 start_codon:yes stop_codon:yes gene_type:complete
MNPLLLKRAPGVKTTISTVFAVFALASSVSGYRLGKVALGLKAINEEIAQREQVSEPTQIEDLRYIEVESIDGRKLEAEVIEHDGETLKFYSMAAKQEYEVSFDRLSDKTQKLLREEIPTRFLDLPQGWADKSHNGEEANAVEDVLTGLSIDKVHIDIKDYDSKERAKYYRLRESRGMMSSNELLESFVCLPNSDRFPVEALRGDLLGEKTSLYGAIEYLMPLHEADLALKGVVEQPSSQMIICPGFPDKAFKLHLYPIKKEYREEYGVNDESKISGYNSIGLAVDGRRQVVAVQLNRTTDVADLPSAPYGSNGHRLFNFLEYKKSATESGGVSIRGDIGTGSDLTLYKTRPQLGFYLFKVDQFSSKKPVIAIRKSFRSDRRLENYSMLMLHANLGRIILYNIEKNWLLQESDEFKRIDSIDMDELLEIRDKLKALPSEGNDQPF